MSISLNTSSSSELLRKSMDLSTNLMAMREREEMKTELNSLKQSLESTQNELDNVILENMVLKKTSISFSTGIGSAETNM